MKYLTGSAEEIADSIIATSHVVSETEVIACSDIVKTLVKILMNKGIRLIRCNVSNDDNWYQISVVDGEMEIGEFYSSSTADVVYFQQDIDEEYVTRTDAEINLFELRYGTD